MNKSRIGFVGLGLMGHGIAKNLVTKGHPLKVRAHRNRKPLEDILAAGATEVATNADLARDTDIVFLCVTGAPQVEEIVNGKDGIASVARTGLIVVDTSTSEPATTAKMRDELAAKGVRFVDAPLARTPVEAEQGRLNIMVGADDATFAELKPVLAAFCENIIHAGPPGHGIVLKLINNFIAQAIATATAEACRRRGEVGLSLAKLHEVISAGAVNSGIFQMMVGRMLDNHGDLTRPQVHAGQRDEGPALLHALRRVAARIGHRRRGRAPEPRQREPPGLRRQVRGVADRGAGEARRRGRSSRADRIRGCACSSSAEPAFSGAMWSTPRWRAEIRSRSSREADSPTTGAPRSRR